MSPSLGNSLRDMMGSLRPAVTGTRSRLTGKRALARRSAMLPAVLGALQAVGVVTTADWTAREVRWSDTDVAIVPIGPPDGPTQLIVKLADPGPALDSLRVQQLQLASLHADPRLADWTAITPRVVHMGSVDGIPYFVESALPGQSASELIGDAQFRERLLPIAAELIAHLHRRTAARIRIDDAILHDWLEVPIGAIDAALGTRGGAHDARRALVSLGAELRSALADREVLMGWMHGDYWPGNILATPDGSRITGLVDWDLSSSTQLALHDPTLLIMMTRRLISGSQLGAIVRDLLADGPIQPVERSTLAAAGLEPSAWGRDRRETVLLAWLRFAGHFAPIDGRSPRWIRQNVMAVLETLPRNRPGRGAR